jgi:histidinol dehydrogenase
VHRRVYGKTAEGLGVKIFEGFEAAKKAMLKTRTGPVERLAQEIVVRKIVDDVIDFRDAALFEYTERFDHVKLDRLEVDKSQIERAYRTVAKDLLAALELAAGRIADFHRRQKKALLHQSTRESLGWLVRPLRRVGIHAPGFTAPLPSSVLMTAVPARVAGVEEIILVTPPGKNGAVSPVTLAAARIAGVDRVFSIGGAQAIAALAFGTESVPRVDKVCGPGNIYVSLAKRLVFGTVGIDGLYGPSEVVIVADATARPAYCAADLLSQAEHGSGASAILITNSRRLAGEVNAEIDRQLETLTRRDIIEKALESRGMIAVVASVAEAIELANLYAPEHLCLVVKDTNEWAANVRNAGCLFIGESSLEVIVDYVAGPSHVLPTEGTARFSSGLNILDFIKLISTVNADRDEIQKLGGAASVIARAEGLDAHARAVEKRLEDMEKGR